MSVRDYVEHLKSKPASTRRQIALGTSALVALVVGVGWFGALAASGELALKGESTSNQATEDLVKASQETSKGFSELMGAVGAFQQGVGNETSIQVVETRASSTLETGLPAEEKTVIPF